VIKYTSKDFDNYLRIPADA